MTHIEMAAQRMTEAWLANEYEIHKRPPFRAHSFDNDGRFWVVGTTNVSVLHGLHGSQEAATIWANALNNSPSARAYLEHQGRAGADA